MFRQQQQSQFPNMNPSYVQTRIQPPNASQPTYSSPLDQVKQYTAKIEDVLENVMDPIKPYGSFFTTIFFFKLFPVADRIVLDIFLHLVDS